MGLAETSEIDRIAVLHTNFSGYMAACQRRLKEVYDVELMVFYWPESGRAPFGEEIYRHIDYPYERDGKSEDEIRETVRGFDPDAVLMAGWTDSAYLRVARTMKKEGVPVVSNLDRQWQGRWKQYAARAVAPWYLWSAIDVMWVPGERQWEFAKRLGYAGKFCWQGMYACDWETFADAQNDHASRDRAFLFAGRYIPEKGMDTLVSAYRRYRGAVEDPWPIICAGAGEEEEMLQAEEGIVNKGFVQPSELPQLFSRVSAFVLPSRWEPWGVVVQEAAASRLPLICSDACGATTHLLQNGYNGFRFQSENVEELASSLSRMSQCTEGEREEMGQRSYELSKQFTPDRWAKTLMEGLTELRQTR